MPTNTEPYGRVYLADSRNMGEILEESVALIITSPPYWHIKDYGVPHQIGYGQTLHEYLYDLARVWRECWRVLVPGRRLCINIGDQFARAVLYGQYKVIPLHAEIIAQCETIGFDYLGAIIWQKKTSMRPSGGAVVMGSFPFPPNGIVELDYEYILIFRKPGKSAPVDPGVRALSALTREEWKTYFSGHWQFGGERKDQHEAMFPKELPTRLIRMFSFVGETILDPFLGSGTTLKCALQLGRSGIGYEIQPAYLPMILQKVGSGNLLAPSVQVIRREHNLPTVDPPEGYVPRIKDAKPLVDPALVHIEPDATYRVVRISRADDGAPLLIMDNGLLVRLLGIRVQAGQLEALARYLQTYLLGKRVILRFEQPPEGDSQPVPAYLYLTNRLFINRKIIEMGLAEADRNGTYHLKNRFVQSDSRRNQSV